MTQTEIQILQAIKDITFNVPEPIFDYLRQIGTYTDDMGKETFLNIPDLPTTIVGGYGGYHAATINFDTHNLYEDIPCLGIIGDTLMTIASGVPNAQPNYRVAIPNHTRLNCNLPGFRRRVGPFKTEITSRSQGITIDGYDEYILNTRINLKYLQSISDILNRFDTFRIEKLTLPNLTMSGGDTQVIRTPITDEAGNYLHKDVSPISCGTVPNAPLGAAYMYAFQVFKEPSTHPQEVASPNDNWCCLSTTQDVAEAWIVPAAWIDNRNQRVLPDGNESERYREIKEHAYSTRSDE